MLSSGREQGCCHSGCPGTLHRAQNPTGTWSVTEMTKRPKETSFCNSSPNIGPRKDKDCVCLNHLQAPNKLLCAVNVSLLPPSTSGKSILGLSCPQKASSGLEYARVGLALITLWLQCSKLGLSIQQHWPPDVWASEATEHGIGILSLAGVRESAKGSGQE